MDWELLSEKISDSGDVLIFSVFALIATSIAYYFEIALALPAFLASLFFVYVLEDSEYSSVKNSVASYAAAAAFGTLAPVILGIVNLAGPVAEIFVSVLLTGLVIHFANVEHPPALGLLPWFALAQITFRPMLGMILCLFLVLGAHAIFQFIKEGGLRGLKLGRAPSLSAPSRKPRKKSESLEDLEKELGELKI